MVEIKNTVTEMKSACDRLISRLHSVEERITELEDMKIELLKLKDEEKKD